MPIKNYTTKIDASVTLGRIQSKLSKKGAKQIMIDYAAGVPTRVCFTIECPNGLQAVALPCNSDKVYQVMQKQGIKCSTEHAGNVAWRIVEDWLDAQLAILETEMVTVEQVMLPYFVNRQGQTVYELYSRGSLMLE